MYPCNVVMVSLVFMGNWLPIIAKCTQSRRTTQHALHISYLLKWSSHFFPHVIGKASLSMLFKREMECLQFSGILKVYSFLPYIYISIFLFLSVSNISNLPTSYLPTYNHSSIMYLYLSNQRIRYFKTILTDLSTYHQQSKESMKTLHPKCLCEFMISIKNIL